ncbi:hypothetical protein Tco_1293293 [Tanacetum coccineum]
MGALVNEGESNKIRPRYENEFPEYKRHIKLVLSLLFFDRIVLMASFLFRSPSIQFSSKGAFSIETSSMSTGLERFVSSGSGIGRKLSLDASGSNTRVSDTRMNKAPSNKSQIQEANQDIGQ